MDIRSLRSSQSKSLLAHEQLWCRSIEIPTGSAKRGPQSLWDTGDTTQDIKVSSQSAASFHQISEGRSEMPAESQVNHCERRTRPNSSTMAPNEGCILQSVNFRLYTQVPDGTTLSEYQTVIEEMVNSSLSVRKCSMDELIATRPDSAVSRLTSVGNGIHKQKARYSAQSSEKPESRNY